MKMLVLGVALVCATPAAGQQAPSQPQSQQPSKAAVAAWQRQAQNVTITRDDWGIPHIHGKTDADAVFGLMYAQAEDDFNRVETNYINAMGRLAEAEGESAVYRDLRMKLFIDPDSIKALYDGEPRVAQDADERVRRRVELLPVHPSPGHAARHHALRALDGTDIQRGQHWRRH